MHPLPAAPSVPPAPHLPAQPGASGAVALLLAASLAAPLSAAAGAPPPADLTDVFARHVMQTGDAAGRPFAVVDKRSAVLAVYRADGLLAGRTVALLGSDPGDHSVPGVGERTQRNALQPGDQTTPAGRFEAMPGRNIEGEPIVWVDFDAAFAIHRLRPGPARAARERLLAASHPSQRRVSAGCVVVPVQFYLHIVQPLLGRVPSVVYVLPETGPVPTPTPAPGWFEALFVSQRAPVEEAAEAHAGIDG